MRFEFITIIPALCSFSFSGETGAKRGLAGVQHPWEDRSGCETQRRGEILTFQLAFLSNFLRVRGPVDLRITTLTRIAMHSMWNISKKPRSP